MSDPTHEGPLGRVSVTQVLDYRELDCSRNGVPGRYGAVPGSYLLTDARNEVHLVSNRDFGRLYRETDAEQQRQRRAAQAAKERAQEVAAERAEREAAAIAGAKADAEAAETLAASRELVGTVRHVGGGWYESTSDEEVRFKGRTAAEDAGYIVEP